MGKTLETLTVTCASAGTGKTYTLAARYIALLMDSGGDRGYRHILAVTFTNKATAEMKQRILSQLYLMSQQPALDAATSFMADVRKYMRRSLSDEEMAAKAGRVCHNILEDYDNMKVSTIDSFLQTLITGMARMLGIGADFGVELDIDHVVRQAVDEVMTSHIDEDKRTMGVLTRYVDERLSNERGWDVRESLVELTKELLREAVLKDESAIVFDPAQIHSYKEALNWRRSPSVMRMRELYNRVKHCEADNAIERGTRFYQFIRRMGGSLENKAKNEQRFKPLSPSDEATLRSSAFALRVGGSVPPVELQQALTEMNKLCPACRKDWLLSDVCTRYLNDLAMMGFVKSRIDQNLQEANCILLARTAWVLQAALKPGDADFILEKAGVRYHHIMIDEFQDTSTLQWQVFRSLMAEVLSSGGTALIVGDVKQSIYRWRNGDYRIMQALQDGREFAEYVKVERQKKNYRSQAEVVRFNLGLFHYLCSEGNYAAPYADIYNEVADTYCIEDYCAKAAQGEAGYVRVRFYPRADDGTSRKREADKSCADKELNSAAVRKHIVTDLLHTINRLIDNGADPSDVLILVSKHREAREIEACYAGSEIEARGIRLCSSDSFLLGSSRSVMVVICAMKAIAMSDAVAALYVKMNCGTDCAEIEFDDSLPLNEMVELLVRKLLIDTEGELRFADAGYLNAFIDETGRFVGRHGSDLRSFLDFWDSTLQAKPVPNADSEGVRIMTIHTAKGLESRYVFIPFCDWTLEDDKFSPKLWVDAIGEPKACQAKGVSAKEGRQQSLGRIPVPQEKNLEQTPYAAAYSAEHEAQRIDNLNKLYVALTRAADHLYVYVPVIHSTDVNAPRSVGDLLLAYLAESTDEKSRKMIAETVSELYKSYCSGDEAVYAEYTAGESSLLSSHSAATPPTPFSPRFLPEDQHEYRFCPESGTMRFRQSQESALYLQKGDDAAGKTLLRIEAGNLRHDIFAQIATVADAPKVIDQFYTKGLIQSRHEAELITAELEQAWHNAQMADWFGGGWQLLREVSILRPKSEYERDVAQWKARPEAQRGPMPKRELRPDRVMLREGKAVVLDFKFGKHNHQKYSQQVKQYMALLHAMGYADVEGYLWYGFDGELVRIQS